MSESMRAHVLQVEHHMQERPCQSLHGQRSLACAAGLARLLQDVSGQCQPPQSCSN